MKPNCIYIYGSQPGKNVKANSKLAEEFHHIMIVMSQNLQGLVCVPDDFTGMRGHDNKTTLDIRTDQYYIKFGVGDYSS